MTDTRTQALAAQYSRIMGTEDQAYHLGAMPAETRSAALTAEQPTRESLVGDSRGPAPNPLVIAECPCGTKATVLEDRVPALLERWRREHEAKEALQSVATDSGTAKGD